ncbi:hypothetical protein [Leptospira noguchii]|uniref:hypothetical protein n=1 Tax=Leptospira noguchii TaxID=28182 RepID=UPI001C68124F|nr:hypothetical protein [Leptospira noguchii]UOG53184.1 hypothetical protein MAL09_03030 [Leptospira noguchii]
MKRFLRKRFRSFDRLRLNSAKRFPELSVSLPMGRWTGRVLGSKTHIFQVFRQE